MVQIDSRFEQALNSYLDTKKLNPKSIKLYLEFYYKFQRLYPILDQRNIDSFLKDNQSSPGRAMMKHLLKAITRWDLPKEIKEEVMMFDIPQISGKKDVNYVPKHLNKSDMDRLIIGIKTGKPHESERLKLMILVQFYAGLRVSELLGLTFNSLNKEAYDKDKETNYQIIKISSESAKFGKARIGYLPTFIYERLLVWVKEDIKINNSKTKYNQDGPLWRIGNSRYRQQFSKWTEEILKIRYNTHSVRHGRGTDLITEQHKSIEFVKTYLGHADISSTQKYVHIEDQDMKRNLELENE